MKSLVAVFIAGILAGAVLAYKFFIPVENPPVKIVKELEPVIKYKYKYVNIENNLEQLRSCYKSPIQLSYNVKEYDMNVKAWTNCKETSQVIKLEVARTGNWRYYIGAGVIAGATSAYLINKLRK